MSHVPMGRPIKLQPKNTDYVRTLLETKEEPNASEQEVNGEDVGSLVCVGDNFAVPTKEGNNEGVEFYGLQCQKANHIVRKNFICPWGGEF